MKKLLLSCLAFVSLLGASACGVEEGAPETTDEAAQPVEAAVFGVWEAGPPQNCIENFGRSCTASIPSNQCNTAVAGASCSPVGKFCYKVNSVTFRDMDCVAAP